MARFTIHVRRDEAVRNDNVSSLRDTSCWLHAAAAAVGQQRTGCYTVAVAEAGEPQPAAVTEKMEPFVGHMAAARRRPATVPGDDMMTD